MFGLLLFLWCFLVWAGVRALQRQIRNGRYVQRQAKAEAKAAEDLEMAEPPKMVRQCAYNASYSE